MILVLSALLIIFIALIVMFLLGQKNRRALIGLIIALPIISALAAALIGIFWFEKMPQPF